MTTVNEVEGQELIFVKGAVDVLLKKCSRLANPAAGQGEVRDGRKRSAAGAGDRFPGVPESGYGTGSRTGAGGVPSRSLSSSDRQKILNQNTLWSSRGLRVLALACRPYAEAGKNAEEEDLIFLGLMAGIPFRGCQRQAGRNPPGDDYRRPQGDGHGNRGTDRHTDAGGHGCHGRGAGPDGGRGPGPEAGAHFRVRPCVAGA